MNYVILFRLDSDLTSNNKLQPLAGTNFIVEKEVQGSVWYFDGLAQV